MESPVWVIALAGVCTALGALIPIVSREIVRLWKARGDAKGKAAREAYDRQRKREESLDEDTQEFIDRQAKIIEDLEQEMSRRWVAERALMTEVAERRAGQSYIWAVAQAFHNQLAGLHQSPCMDLPPRPVFPPPGKEREEQEYEIRRRQHNTDLINTEAMVVKQRRPDSDVKSSPTNGGGK